MLMAGQLEILGQMPPRTSSLPHNLERRALQLLLSGNWKPAMALYPTAERTLAKMNEKGWIEGRKLVQMEYKITDPGREALRARLPEKLSKKSRYRE